MDQDPHAAPKKTIEEVMAEFDRTHNIPINITDNITHSEFVDGMKKKRLAYTSVGEPNQFLAFPEKLLFEILCLSYTVFPIILISIWAYLNRSWWSLIGIPISYLGAFSGASKSKLIYFFLCICIWNWLTHGFDIHQFCTFYFFCALWGYALFNVAEGFQRNAATAALLRNSDLFSDAIANKRIMVFLKREASQEA
jgi:hypothetical protein